MDDKVIEGTWEEVTRKGHELAGHRVRVTVLERVAVLDVPAEVESGHVMAVTTPGANRRRRSPGPFLEDESLSPPVEMPRGGTVIKAGCIWVEGRWPDLPLDESTNVPDA